MMRARWVVLLFLVLTLIPFGYRSGWWQGGLLEPGRVIRKAPNDWLYLQRLFPHEQLPADLHSRAVSETRLIRQQRTRTGVWENVGPENIGGRITALTVHPDYPERVWIGAAEGGVWRSDDGGTNWVSQFDQQNSLAIGDLCVDPSNPLVLYAGTGEANASGDSYPGDGIYRSSDGGNSWEHLGLSDTQSIGRIQINPANPDEIWVAAAGPLFTTNEHRGVYHSLDGGETWEQSLFLTDSTSAIDLVLKPDDPQTVYAAMWERLRRPNERIVGGMSSSIWRTTDAGETWEPLSEGLPSSAPHIGRIGLAVSPEVPERLVAFYVDHPGYFLGLFESNDAGDSFYQLNDGALGDLTASFGWYFGKVFLDPDDADHIFVQGVEFVHSTDNGNSWSYLTGNNVHVDHHGFYVQGNRMYDGNDGGFYVSLNGGDNWTHNPTLPVSQFYEISYSAAQPDIYIGGTQDNGTLISASSDPQSWTRILGGDGFHCIIHPQNPDTIFAEYQWGYIRRSFDGGDNFNTCDIGINSGDRRNWNTPIAISPLDPATLYYGTYRLYRTQNLGDSWTSISSDLTGGDESGSLVFSTLTAIHVAADRPGRVYVGSDDGYVWRTDDDGYTWESIDAGLPQRTVTAIKTNPEDTDEVWISFSGYAFADPISHVYFSQDAGASWVSIGDGLPDTPVNGLALDLHEDIVLFVGTDTGVFGTRDMGTTWEAIGDNLPFIGVYDLEVDSGRRWLLAGTHGRSLYRFELSQLDQVSGGVDVQPESMHLNLYPNPFNGPLSIQVDLVQPARISVKIFDVLGKLVDELPIPEQSAHYNLSWNGRSGSDDEVPSGVYLVQVKTPREQQVRHVTLVR